jgi:hypothetical protein
MEELLKQRADIQGRKRFQWSVVGPALMEIQNLQAQEELLDGLIQAQQNAEKPA